MSDKVLTCTTEKIYLEAKHPESIETLAIRMGTTPSTLQSIINIMKVFEEGGEIRDGKIFISSKHPERAITGILWALSEIIKINNDEMIASCFIKAQGEWDKKLLQKYRNKFSGGEESKKAIAYFKEMFRSLQ